MVVLEDIVTMLAGASVLMAWSVMYRESIWYRLPENMLIGTAMGYTLRNSVRQITSRALVPLFQEGQYGDIAIWVGLILGLMYLLRWFPPTRWISRFPMSYQAGLYTGYAVRAVVIVNIIELVGMGSLTATGTKYGTPTALNNLIIAMFTFTVMSYFLFTYRHRGVLGISARIGRVGLMIAFGMVMGTYLITNISFAIGHMRELVSAPWVYLVPFAIIGVLIGIIGDTRGWFGHQAETY